jgi:hypothetical protein
VRLVQHTGSTGGYRAALFRFPDQHTSMAMLCNASTANTTALAKRMADVVLRDVLGPMPPISARAATVPTAAPNAGVANLRLRERAAIAGRYASAELNDAVWSIVAEGDAGALQLVLPRRTAVTLVPTATALEYTDGAGLTLRFDSPVRGTSMAFVLNGSRVQGVRFVRAH